MGRTTLCARAGLDGDVHARLVQKIGSSMEVKASTNSHLKEIQGNVHEGSVDITGRSYTLQGKLAWQGAWLLGGAYMQQLTSALQLGGDLNLIDYVKSDYKFGMVMHFLPQPEQPPP